MNHHLGQVAVCVVALVAGAVAVPPGAPADGGGSRQPVTFEVKNPQQGGAAATIAGYRYDPPCPSTTALLLLHGLSYTKEVWDVPGYSVAQALAAGGFTVFTVDRLGYGESKLDDGYGVSSEAYAAMTDQMVRDLRAAGFDHVGLVGHSAGAEVAELTAGLYGSANAVAALGYHHRPSDQIVTDFFTGDNPRALQDDYEYFLGTPGHRQEMFFTPAADPAVVAADREAAVLTPSGEILSIGKQPSRPFLPRITVPVYLQLGDSDRLFEPKYLDWERMQFAQSPAVTIDIVPESGHTHMLHRAGPAATSRLIEWFRAHREETPPCN